MHCACHNQLDSPHNDISGTQISINVFTGLTHARVVLSRREVRIGPAVTRCFEYPPPADPERGRAGPYSGHPRPEIDLTQKHVHTQREREREERERERERERLNIVCKQPTSVLLAKHSHTTMHMQTHTRTHTHTHTFNGSAPGVVR